MNEETKATGSVRPASDLEQPISAEADPALAWEAVVQRAVKSRASDIHLLAQKDRYDLVFRVDGDMTAQGPMDRHFAQRLINHVKSIAGMDIAEHRRPMEGRLKIDIDEHAVDVRISVVPAIRGSDMVVRLLNHEMGLMALGELGMLPEQLSTIHEMLARPGGLLLFSGPTGSGKTTTLYAALRHLAGHKRKIITIEDPVEYELPDTNQTQVNPRIGVTYASMLTAVLRQDPDIIMVGEVRDSETAMTATRAANMGNLVLATSHATRASQAIETMLNLNVHPFFLATAFQGVVTQLLVKRVCPHCRQPMPETVDMILDEKIRKRISTGVEPQIYQGRGCEHCMGTGYYGRMGLFELLSVDDRIKNLILERRSATEVENAFAETHGLSIDQVGKLAAVTGQTTIEELVRVLPAS